MFCNLYFRYYLISGHNQNSSFITYKHNSLFVFNANQILSIDRNNSSMTIVQLHSIGTTTNKKILWLLHMLYFFFHSYCLIILLYWLNELNMSTGKFPINQLLTQERFFVNRNNWPTSLWLTKKKKKFFTEKWRFRFRSYIFFLTSCHGLMHLPEIMKQSFEMKHTVYLFLVYYQIQLFAWFAVRLFTFTKHENTNRFNTTTTKTFRPYVIYSNAMCCMNDQTT